MKINGPSGLGAPSASGRARPASPGFSVASGGSSGAAAPAAGVSASSGVGSVDALLALQAEEGPTERRRRAVRRAGGLLDRLDEVRMALLSGDSPAPALQGLGRQVRETRGGVEDDPQLHRLLAQIDLRAAVELAKAQVAGTR